MVVAAETERCKRNRGSRPPKGDPLAQYYYANGEIVARKMFGFKGRKDQGYLGNLRDRGHLLFYHYDQIGSVTDLTDHLGSEVVKYRYDAFGGLFTNAWSPYNYVGLTGKSYDPKASLMDYSARWYSPNNQRFTTRDTWTGDITLPQTLNRYAYALDNPLKYNDPTGHRPLCYAYSESECNTGGLDGTGGGQQEETYTPVDTEPDGLTLAELIAIAKRTFNEAAGSNPTWRSIQDFSQGFDYQLINNYSLGLFGATHPEGDPQNQSTAYQVGAIVADLYGIVSGSAEFIAGTGGTVVLVGSGGGIVLAPATPAVAAYGGTVAVKSASSLGKDTRTLFSKDGSSGGSEGTGKSNIRKTSQTFGKEIETIYGGKKVKLRVDAEPDGNKIQIQAGKGKKSNVDIRIDPNRPVEGQIPKNLKRSLTDTQYNELLKNLQRAVDYLKD